MNENLKRLMVQADYPAPEIAKRAQELAELIVRECADIVDTLNEAYDAPSTAGKLIKQHFGVGE